MILWKGSSKAKRSSQPGKKARGTKAPDNKLVTAIRVQTMPIEPVDQKHNSAARYTTPNFTTIAPSRLKANKT
ncbi:hypothetical protein D3C71_2136620 [compost metagenome]